MGSKSLTLVSLTWCKVASVSPTGCMVGTPEYIAPEQLKDCPIDIRTDLYGMGIMMFEMLTGKIPFEGESAESILMKHLLEY